MGNARDISVLPEAIEDLREAYDYYELQQAGLGEDLAVEVSNAIQRILDTPEAWPALTTWIRRCLTKRFPYGVLYRTRGDDISIIAVMHLHRHQDSWKRRIS